MTNRRVDDIEQAVRAESFTPLGWIAVAESDGVPDVAAGAPARAVALIGNAGPAMWQRFSGERASKTQTLDDWSSGVLGPLAARLDAHAHFPFAKPALPFQRWAARSGLVHASPLGISIHRTFGLWHAYRAAFAFADEIALPDHAPDASPCDSCADRPCLSTCPVGAFSGSAYDVPVCAAHIATPDGADCVDLGCRARRACPVGRENVYQPDQAHFHMTAFVRAWSQMI